MSVNAPSKHFLLLCRKAPDGRSHAREAIDVALTAAAFDQPTALAFADDGVFQLLPGHSFSSLLEALEIYGIEQLYVEAEALSQRGLNPEQLLIPAQPLNRDDFADLLEKQSVLLSF